MPGFNPSQLSSNWKKLQEKLQTERKTEPQQQENGLKRKRTATTSTSATTKPTSTKKQRPAPSTTTKPPTKLTTKPPPRRLQPSLRAKMGATASTPEPPQPQPIPNPLTTRPTLDLPTNPPNPPHHPTHKPGKYIALDCEMVGHGPPPHALHLLARVSVVNYHGEQLYDTLVLPPSNTKIEDYRTEYSGIRAGDLVAGNARPFAEVQTHVAALLRERILVGHALRNDLAVLELSHPKADMRDTSRYPPFRVESGGKPAKLRDLVRRELGVGIQVQGTGGHSSLEDARGAMALVRGERGGFEAEARRWGGGGGVARGARGAGVKGAVTAVEAEDSDGDVDGVEGGSGEEGSEGEVGGGAAGPKTKRKRKKKKRTKRK